jgi:hypothetical protein
MLIARRLGQARLVKLAHGGLVNRTDAMQRRAGCMDRLEGITFELTLCRHGHPIPLPFQAPNFPFILKLLYN